MLVAGSHGGRYCGYLAALAGLRGVILNDAGVGKDDAVFASLAYLAPLGIAAATIAHTSARIGDGGDMLARGVVSQCNAPARALGCAVGQRCEAAAQAMQAGAPFEGEPPPHAEGRIVLRESREGGGGHGRRNGIIGCDSAALVQHDDAGLLIVTGSHGGTLAGRPGYGIAAEARGAVFNDAGVGVDDAGIQRLGVLDQANIAAVTVDAMSACIGDARSAWESGVVSYTNRHAATAGAEAGMSIPDFANLLD